MHERAVVLLQAIRYCAKGSRHFQSDSWHKAFMTTCMYVRVAKSLQSRMRTFLQAHI